MSHEIPDGSPLVTAPQALDAQVLTSLGLVEADRGEAHVFLSGGDLSRLAQARASWAVCSLSPSGRGAG